MQRDAVIVQCFNGVFVLPDEVFSRFKQVATSGMMYLRENEDVLTIASTRIVDGRRRTLRQKCRAAMFRAATRLAIVEVADQLNIMPIEWRRHVHSERDALETL